MDEPIETWIRAHRVCWDMLPLRGRREGDHPGLELTLLARCDGGLDPARTECRVAYGQLVEIVQRVLPPETRHHFEPYGAALHLRPESAFAPEVELIAEVFAGSDAAAGLRTSVPAALAALGVQARAWSDGVLPPTGRAVRSVPGRGLVGAAGGQSDSDDARDGARRTGTGARAA